MGHIFTKRKQTRITEQDKAILELKTTRDKIKQYQRRSEGILEKDRSLAKKLLEDNKKERALLLLKKKRFIEQKLNDVDGQLNNVEQMIQSLEVAQMEMKVIENLRTGNDALKIINKLLSIEDVEQILEETSEAAEKQKEITELLGGDFMKDEETDDLDTLEAELEAMLGGPEVSPPAEISLPEVPETEIGERVKKPAKVKERIPMEAS